MCQNGYAQSVRAYSGFLNSNSPPKVRACVIFHHSLCFFITLFVALFVARFAKTAVILRISMLHMCEKCAQFLSMWVCTKVYAYGTNVRTPCCCFTLIMCATNMHTKYMCSMHCCVPSICKYCTYAHTYLFLLLDCLLLHYLGGPFLVHVSSP